MPTRGRSRRSRTSGDAQRTRRALAAARPRRPGPRRLYQLAADAPPRSHPAEQAETHVRDDLVENRSAPRRFAPCRERRAVDSAGVAHPPPRNRTGPFIIVMNSASNGRPARIAVTRSECRASLRVSRRPPPDAEVWPSGGAMLWSAVGFASDGRPAPFRNGEPECRQLDSCHYYRGGHGARPRRSPRPRVAVRSRRVSRSRDRAGDSGRPRPCRSHYAGERAWWTARWCRALSH